MATITLNNIAKNYGAVEVISGLDLDIFDGEFVVLVGPSGCGKSTLLRMIAGLESISGGDLVIDAERVNAKPPRDRDIAMVFQSYALYPHMNVERNMGFSMEIRKEKKSLKTDRVGKAATKLGLTPFLDRLPKALSGGQRQRVAMGRAIVRNPKAFLFDEPLSNLDAALRVGMRLEIARLHRELGTTMVYVTHDQVEAMTLADRIVVMNLGNIEQVGTPIELYEKPANLFVANFIGSPTMNIFDCSFANGGIILPNGTFLPLPAYAISDQQVSLGIRPEHIQIATNGPGQCQGEVEIVERLGSDTMIYTNVSGWGLLVTRLNGTMDIKIGDAIALAFDQPHIHLFNDTGAAIRVGV
ncbi:sn-glycerol-3-phosphate ABC transporter ATP-binding protein UgpC [Devosia rhodophyticola]|uniref:Sn-glycerol-3-phosphate ABC transporter ATP-binding protein UgpC n=1 Tax=Devosia rhodophyticola TaxID=3026423 RepID=A0ABY7Z1S8_9HYPH|nr:sn-glycerol-3-phosphate ABC transporter ATP-binding protein UgpC [Devosia rhodophyticola]WDR07442.1 sn-glycerol-3-phosphate ABC transporter ATP-binding protein UgpC [Devosia rhodophyticola]